LSPEILHIADGLSLPMTIFPITYEDEPHITGIQLARSTSLKSLR
jgi:hypothetical protein